VACSCRSSSGRTARATSSSPASGDGAPRSGPGCTSLPVIVREVTEPEAFELALIENIQREDLNAIEEAEAYQRLIEHHGLTQEELAQRVGKDRSTIANALRLSACRTPSRKRWPRAVFPWGMPGRFSG